LEYTQDIRDKIDFIYFFATPSAGSDFARVGSLALPSAQLRNLSPTTGESFLRDLQTRWLSAGFGKTLSSYCAYETIAIAPVGGLVVPWASAFGLCNERVIAIQGNHQDVVKPREIGDKPHMALRTAFIDSRREESRHRLSRMVPSPVLNLQYHPKDGELTLTFNAVVRRASGITDVVTDVYGKFQAMGTGEIVPFGVGDAECVREGRPVSPPFLFESELVCTFRHRLNDTTTKVLSTVGDRRFGATFETDIDRGHTVQFCFNFDADELASFFGPIPRRTLFYVICRDEDGKTK
jgi:hypothetical protein